MIHNNKFPVGKVIDPGARDLKCVVTSFPEYHRIYALKRDVLMKVMGPGLFEFCIVKGWVPPQDNKILVQDGVALTPRMVESVVVSGTFLVLAIPDSEIPTWWDERPGA